MTNRPNSAFLDLNLDINESALLSTINFRRIQSWPQPLTRRWARATIGSCNAFQAEIRNVATQRPGAKPFPNSCDPMELSGGNEILVAKSATLTGLFFA